MKGEGVNRRFTSNSWITSYNCVVPRKESQRGALEMGVQGRYYKYGAGQVQRVQREAGAPRRVSPPLCPPFLAGGAPRPTAAAAAAISAHLTTHRPRKRQRTTTRL